MKTLRNALLLFTDNHRSFDLKIAVRHPNAPIALLVTHHRSTHRGDH